MTKEELLDLLQLLSALESWAMAHKTPLPEYLTEELDAYVKAVRREILKG